MSTPVLIARPGYSKFRVADLKLNIVGNPVYGERTSRETHGKQRVPLVVRSEKTKVIFTCDGEDYIMPLMNSKGNVIQASVFNYDRIVRSASLHSEEAQVDSDTREILRKLSSGVSVTITPDAQAAFELLQYIRKYWTVVPSKTTTAESSMDEDLEITEIIMYCVVNEH